MVVHVSAVDGTGPEQPQPTTTKVTEAAGNE